MIVALSDKKKGSEGGGRWLPARVRRKRSGGAPMATYFGYDALNRLDKVLDAEGGHAYFGYDPGGNTERVLDALDRPTYFAYDQLDRLTAVTDALAQSVHFGYDPAGNRNREMDALAHSTYYFYDLGDRLESVLDPLGKAAYYGYDANSNLARTLDHNGAAVYFEYDGLDRRAADGQAAEAEKVRLFEQIGRLKVELDGLKKKLDRSSSGKRALIDGLFRKRPAFKTPRP